MKDLTKILKIGILVDNLKQKNLNGEIISTILNNEKVKIDTIIINQSSETKKCKIKGTYADNKLKINSIQDAHKNNKNCKEIINNTDLKFIGDFDDISTVSSDGQCGENTKPCPSKVVDIDY